MADQKQGAPEPYAPAHGFPIGARSSFLMRDVVGRYPHLFRGMEAKHF